MDHEKLRRNVDGLLVIYSLVPLSLLLVFYSFVVRARIELGHWPMPYTPDPKDLSFAREHMDLVFWLFTISVCCFLPWLLLAQFRIRLVPNSIFRPVSILVALPWILVPLAVVTDFGDYVTWFLD